MAVYERFDQFLRNIELTTVQREDVSTKRHNVGRVLHSAYYENAYSGSSNFLGGSHGKQTAIRPPSDIDLMFVVPYETFRGFEQRLGNKQSQLLQHIRTHLVSSFSSTQIRADGQVVTVPFSSYRVEVVPCVLLTSGGYWICDTNDGGRWKVTNPTAELNALIASDRRTNGNTRKLIKMVKAWRGFCGVPIKSILVEIVAQEFLATWAYADKTSAYFDWMVRDFFAFLYNRKNQYAFVSGTSESLSLGDEWASRALTAYQRAKKACDHEIGNQETLASSEWKKIFGDDFPSPPVTLRTLLGGGYLE